MSTDKYINNFDFLTFLVVLVVKTFLKNKVQWITNVIKDFNNCPTLQSTSLFKLKFDMHKEEQQEYLEGNSKKAYVEGGVF